MNKKSLYTVLAILIFAGLACGVAAFAANIAGNDVPTVVFDAKKVTDKTSEDAFSYENASKYSDNEYVDFMPEFKNLMPGDSVSSSFKIDVNNIGNNKVKSVKIYLSPEYNSDIDGVDSSEDVSDKKAYNEDYEVLLNSISKMITIKVDGEEYSADLENGAVLLGEFKKDKVKSVSVKFDFPKECGNEYSDLIAELGWKFTAEVVNRDNALPITIISTIAPYILNVADLNKDDHYAYIYGYPDGKVYPLKEITRAEAATIIFRLLSDKSRNYYWSEHNDYSDVSDSDWFNNAVSTLSDADIIHGYPDGSFRPYDKITRAEMAKLVSTFAELSSVYSSFKDVDGHWAEEYIEMASGNGWIKGYADGTFKPNKDITRAEAVTLLNRVLNRVPSSESKLIYNGEMKTYPDCEPGKWYYIAIQEATNSHDYDRDNINDSSDEKWTNIRENFDWTLLEK